MAETEKRKPKFHVEQVVFAAKHLGQISEIVSASNGSKHIYRLEPDDGLRLSPWYQERELRRLTAKERGRV